MLLLELDDVNVTDPPEQNVVGPLLFINGVGGIGFGFTVIKVGSEVDKQFPLETETE